MLYEDINPLSGLPGNKSIKKMLSESFDSAEKITVYVDIADFKPYNEIYGFSAGDNVIVSMAELLDKVCSLSEIKDPFIGHIGGDDFILIISSIFISVFFENLDREFSALRKSFYSQEDLSRGFIIANDRKGNRTRLPLMGLCAVAFSPVSENLRDANQISEFSMYLKESAHCVRKEGNILVTPDKLNFLPVPVKQFILDDSIDLASRRTIIEALGERGMVHMGRILLELLDKNIHMLLKKSIIFSLGRLRYHKAEQKIQSFLKDSNAHLRMRAVEALGQIGGARYMEDVAYMLNDRNPYVSSAAVRSLGNIGEKQAMAFLKKFPAKKRSRIFLDVLVARASMGDKSVSEGLLEYSADKNPAFRKKAVLALAKVPQLSNAEKIYSIFESEKIADNRKAAAAAFADIVNNMSRIQLSKIKSLLWKYLKKADPEISCRILPLLAMVEKKKAEAVIKKKLGSSSSIERMFAVESLIHYKDKKNIYRLRSLLNDNDYNIRAVSAKVIGLIGDIQSLEYLRRMLKDEEAHVRSSVSEAILKIATEHPGQICK